MPAFQEYFDLVLVEASLAVILLSSYPMIHPYANLLQIHFDKLRMRQYAQHPVGAGTARAASVNDEESASHRK